MCRFLCEQTSHPVYHCAHCSTYYLYFIADFPPFCRVSFIFISFLFHRKAGPLLTLATNKDINYSQWKTLEIVLVCNDLLIRSQILWDLASCLPHLANVFMYGCIEAHKQASMYVCTNRCAHTQMPLPALCY